MSFHRLVRRLLFALYLMIFSAYAVSPVYLSNGDIARWGKDHLCSRADVHVGILSVRIILSSLIGNDSDDAPATDSIIYSNSQDDELLLMQKKHCAIRECRNVKPLLKTAFLAPREAGLDTVCTREYCVPDAPDSQKTSIYSRHTTGLSPPLLFS